MDIPVQIFNETQVTAWNTFVHRYGFIYPDGTKKVEYERSFRVLEIPPETDISSIAEQYGKECDKQTQKILQSLKENIKGKTMSKISVSLCLCVMVSVTLTLLACGGGGGSVNPILNRPATLSVEVNEIFEGQSNFGAGVDVFVYSGAAIAYQGVTDASGRYYIDPITPGKYRIVVDTNESGYPQERNVTIGSGDHSFQIFNIEH